MRILRVEKVSHVENTKRAREMVNGCITTRMVGLWVKIIGKMVNSMV